MLKFVQKSLLSVAASLVLATSIWAAPAMAFNIRDYRITSEDAQQRAVAAVQAEGYQIMNQGPGYVIAAKGLHMATITWLPADGVMRMHIVVASETRQLDVAVSEVNNLRGRVDIPVQVAQMTVGRGMARNTFSPGEVIQVPFESPVADAQQGWVGIRHAGSNNLRGRFAVEYLRGNTSGVVTFRAPAARGDYEIVIFNREPPQDGDRPIAAIPLYVR